MSSFFSLPLPLGIASILVSALHHAGAQPVTAPSPDHPSVQSLGNQISPAELPAVTVNARPVIKERNQKLCRWRSVLHGVMESPAARLAAQTAANPTVPSQSPVSAMESIRKVMLDTWDRPDARLDVGPITVEGNYALAGWTQGDHGGRALLTRNAQNQWHASVCGGDGLTDAKTLALTGMRPEAAHQFARHVAKAEAALASSRRALFSSFDGMLRMNEGGNHSAHE